MAGVTRARRPRRVPEPGVGRRPCRRRRRHAAGPAAAARRRFRSSRCTRARTTWAARCASRCAGCCRARPSASSRCGRSRASVRAVFVPLSRLQQDLEIPGRGEHDPRGAGAPAQPSGRGPRRRAAGAAGRRARSVPRSTTWASGCGRCRAPSAIAIESSAGLLDERQEGRRGRRLPPPAAAARPIFTYLANTLRVGRPRGAVLAGGRPWTARCPFPPQPAGGAAADRAQRVGRARPGRQRRRSPVDGLLPVGGPRAAGHRSPRSSPSRPSCRSPPAIATWRPTIRGSAIRPTIDDWDPPFPVDLRRVRPQDEAYWNRLPHDAEGVHPARGRASACGAAATARSRRSACRRARTPASETRSGARPARCARAWIRWQRAWPCATCAARRWRRRAAPPTSASTSSTSASSWWCRRCCWRRSSSSWASSSACARWACCARSGSACADVRGVFLREGAVLALAGGVLGLAGALGYAWLIVTGLRTWWVDAVGTTALSVHVSAASLAGGAARGLRRRAACASGGRCAALSRVTERSLLAGDLAVDVRRRRSAPRAAPRMGCVAVVLAVPGPGPAGGRGRRAASIRPPRSSAPAPLLLGAALSLVAHWARRPPGRAVAGRGWGSVGRLGAAQRVVPPGPRGAVGGRGGGRGVHPRHRRLVPPRRRPRASADRASGTGGYSVMVESLLPLVHDLGTRGRTAGARPDAAGRRAARTFPRAARRRRQLSQPLRADAAAHPGRARQLPARGPLRVPVHGGRQRRRARQPVAAARAPLRRRRRSP